MGILNDVLPPNVYTIGSPQENDTFQRVTSGLMIVREGAAALRGDINALGMYTGFAVMDEVVGLMTHWCMIDLNNYTIGIDGSDMRPLSEIRYAELRPENSLLFGFDKETWMGVSPEQVSFHQKNLLKYILPFTSLPVDYYQIDPSQNYVENISRNHAGAWMDFYFRQ